MLLFFFCFCQPGQQFQAFFRTALNTGSTEDAAEFFKPPLFGVAADLYGVGRTLLGTESAENTLVFFDDKFSSFAGEGFTLLKGVVTGDGTFDQIAENIFEYGKKTHFNAPYS